MKKIKKLEKGTFCPICKDWIVSPEEIITENIEVIVTKHYEDFHTVEECEDRLKVNVDFKGDRK